VAEAWVSEDSLKSFPEFQTSIESLCVSNEKSAIADYDGMHVRKPNGMEAMAPRTSRVGDP